MTTFLINAAVLRGLVITLVMVISIQWAMGFYQIHQLAISPTKLAQQPILVRLTEKSLALNTPLFGVYVPESPAKKPIRPSSLNIQVRGIFFSPDQHVAQVILKPMNGQEKNFHVGDTIPGGGLIKRITQDGCEIEHNRVLEQISLPKKPLTFDSIKPIL